MKGNEAEKIVDAAGLRHALDEISYSGTDMYSSSAYRRGFEAGWKAASEFHREIACGSCRRTIRRSHRFCGRCGSPNEDCSSIGLEKGLDRGAGGMEKSK